MWSLILSNEALDESEHCIEEYKSLDTLVSEKTLEIQQCIERDTLSLAQNPSKKRIFESQNKMFSIIQEVNKHFQTINDRSRGIWIT